jgi:hypothetical protein
MPREGVVEIGLREWLGPEGPALLAMDGHSLAPHLRRSFVCPNLIHALTGGGY